MYVPLSSFPISDSSLPHQPTSDIVRCVLRRRASALPTCPSVLWRDPTGMMPRAQPPRLLMFGWHTTPYYFFIQLLRLRALPTLQPHWAASPTIATWWSCWWRQCDNGSRPGGSFVPPPCTWCCRERPSGYPACYGVGSHTSSPSSVGTYSM